MSDLELLRKAAWVARETPYHRFETGLWDTIFVCADEGDDEGVDVSRLVEYAIKYLESKE